MVVVLKMAIVAIVILIGGAGFLLTMTVTTVAAIVAEQLLGPGLEGMFMNVHGDPSNTTDDAMIVPG